MKNWNEVILVPEFNEQGVACYRLDGGDYLNEYYILSEAETRKLLNTPEDFTPADSIYGLDSYSLGDHVRYFPMTESDPGRAMKKLLHIEPAKITAESEAARFKPESGK